MLTTRLHTFCASLLALAPFFNSKIVAQSPVPPIQWQKSLGGNDMEGYSSIAQTSDGGSIVASTTLSLTISGNKTENNVGLADIWVVKLDANGAIQWQNVIGGNNHELVHDIKQTTDGGYIIAGDSQSQISGDKTEPNRGVGGYGNSDYWIVKLDANGAVQWDKSYGGTASDEAHVVEQTADGGFIVGGDSRSPISGDKTEVSSNFTDFWVLKLNAAGAIQWQKTIGSNGYDSFTSLKSTIDGGFILGGFTFEGGLETGFTRYGAHDYWVVKIDATGNIQWNKTYGGKDEEFLHALEQTPDGGYLLAGYSNSPISGVKTQVRKGNYGDYWVIKTDASGTIQWQNTYGGNSMDYLRSLVKTNDGGFLLGGYSFSTPSFDKASANNGSADFWVVKINATGNLQWEKTIGGDGDDIPESMNVLADGTILLAGSTESTLSGNKTENLYGSSDIWVVKLGTPAPSDAPLAFDKFYCLNVAATPLTANGSNLLWYAAATGGIGSAIAPTPSTAIAGTTPYYVSQTVNNVESARTEVKVTVHQPIPIQIVGNFTSCPGQSVYLQTNAANGVWNTGVTYPQISVYPLVTTTYSINGSDINGCVGSDSKTVTVNPLPNVVISGPSSICKGNMATLSATGGNTYKWSTTAVTAAINVAPLATTTYTVTATLNGCSKVASRVLTVNSIGTVAILGLNAQYNKTVLSVPLAGTPIGGYFQIDNNGIPVTTLRPYKLTVGTHTVTYTVNQGACSASYTQNVNIVSGSTVSNLSSSTIFHFGAALEFDRVKFKWYNNTAEENDYFILQKLDKQGTFMDLVHQNAKDPRSNPNFEVYTAYDEKPEKGENFYRLRTVFMDGSHKDSEIEKIVFEGLKKLEVYPNPVQDVVNVLLKNYMDEPVDLLIYDPFGKIILSQSIEAVNSPTVTVDVSGFLSGLYTIRVSTPKKRDATAKFIVHGVN
jgi:Secretion system C-terminal sorting domain